MEFYQEGHWVGRGLLPLCYHYVVIATKDILFQVNQSTIRNMLYVTMISLVTWVTSTDNVTSHWPLVTP